MSLPLPQRGLPRHSGVPSIQIGRSGGKENPRLKQPAQNILEPAYPTDHRLTTAVVFNVADIGANRKRMNFFVKHVRCREATVVATVELCRSKEITMPLFR